MKIIFILIINFITGSMRSDQLHYRKNPKYEDTMIQIRSNLDVKHYWL